MHSTIPEHICKNQSLVNRLKVAIEHIKLMYEPFKIILFGSYARGDFQENSTIDILIIANTELRFIDRIRNAIDVTVGEPPIEPLIYTPGEFSTLRNQGEGFIESAIEEGILLYEKKDSEELVRL